MVWIETPKNFLAAMPKSRAKAGEYPAECYLGIL